MQTNVETDAKSLTYSFFMMIKTTDAWLALPPKERFAFVREVLEPVTKAHPAVRMRYFDAEAFTAKCTDVMLWETEQVLEYQEVVEGLRETKWWGHYFEIVEIIPAIENMYARHYKEGVIQAG